MGRVKDITGQTFGRLTALRFVRINRHKKAMWECECECGSIGEFSSNLLVRGHTRSCGCLIRDVVSGRNSTHGLRSDPAYRCWSAMMERCTDSRHPSFHNYGGRGILVCERWHDVRNFVMDMGPRPSMKHQIDRIDNDGNYEPDNCRWVTKRQQARNRRTNRILEYNGRRMALIEWAECFGIKVGTLRSRVRRGWPIEDALHGRGAP